MKYLYLLTFIAALLPIINISAQTSCSSVDITLLDQGDVDSLQIRYGTCDSILGTLTIGLFGGPTTDIKDLSPLSNLKFTHSLLIYNNDSLESFSGLENLEVTSISKLSIAFNDILNDVSQLSGFGPGGGDISFVKNDSLKSLAGLESLRSVGEFQVRDMISITDLNPLSGISKISRRLVVKNNDSLTDISGLSNVVLFGGAASQVFRLSENDVLEDCAPLCFVIQRVLPLLDNLTKEIQNNLSECADESAILNACLDANNGIYSGDGEVPMGTIVSLNESIQFDTTTLVVDGLNNRVGIGTLTPAATLEVDGTVRLTSLPTSGTLDRIVGLDANGDAFEYDIRSEISDSIAAIVHTVDTKLSETEVEAFIDGDEVSFSNWDKDASDDFDGVFTSLNSIPSGLTDGDDDTQLSDTDIANMGYIKSANDADSDPTNELYDDSEIRDSIAILRGIISDLQSQGSGANIYDTDGSLSGNRSITMGSNDINYDANTLVIDGSDNKVGIGTSTPTYELDVIGDVGISGAIYGLSDARLKKNEKPITGALDIISKLNPVSYLFRSEEYSNFNLPEQQQYGLLAQELQEVLPELVSSKIGPDGKEYLTVNYDGLIAVLIQAVRELRER